MGSVTSFGGVFVHVPKTGGTSVEKFLTEAFPHPGTERDEALSGEKHAKVLHWASRSNHLMQHEIRFFIVVWRAPHQRVLSHYLWRLQFSPRFEKFEKKLTFRGLLRSARRTPSLLDFVEAPSYIAGNPKLLILNFESLSHDLSVLLKVFGGESTQTPAQLNKNPLKEEIGKISRFWVMAAKLITLFTPLRRDHELNPRGRIVFTELPRTFNESK